MTAVKPIDATTAAAATGVTHGSSKYDSVPMPEDKFVNVGRCASTGRDITICYHTYGKASDPCLLLVMGLGWTGWHWRPDFVDRLVQSGFYVVCYDNRDVGLSTHLDGFPTILPPRLLLPSWASWGEGQPPYSLYDMAEDGMNLLTSLGVEKAHVLGTSMGGMIVQCMALRHPERVKSLTIVYSHSGGPNVKPMTYGMMFSMIRSPSGNAHAQLVDFAVEMCGLYTGDYPLDEAVMRATADLTLKRCPDDPEGVVRQIWAIQRAESRDAGLQQLKGIPTLILHGMEDTMVPFENGLQLARLIDGSRLVAFARMGHSIPKDLFDDVVGEMILQKQRGEANAGTSSGEPVASMT